MSRREKGDPIVDLFVVTLVAAAYAVAAFLAITGIDLPLPSPYREIVGGLVLGMRSSPVLGLPVAFVLIAVTAWRWRTMIRQQRSLDRAHETRAGLATLTPDQFEAWCEERLRAAGHSVRMVGGQSDHGVDLVAQREGEITIVQCERYVGKRAVGEPQVRDLFGAMHDFGATRAMAITAGWFSAPARAWADGKPIDLWDVE